MLIGKGVIMNNIHLYQKLKTTTNEFVTIVKIEKDEIVVFYKGNLYRRNKNIIGEKLFVVEVAMVKPKSKRKTCNDCMLMRSEECVGAKEICEFFKYAPTIPKEEMVLWPTMGDALSIKFGKFK